MDSSSSRSDVLLAPRLCKTVLKCWLNDGRGYVLLRAKTVLQMDLNNARQFRIKLRRLATQSMLRVCTRCSVRLHAQDYFNTCKLKWAGRSSCASQKNWAFFTKESQRHNNASSIYSISSRNRQNWLKHFHFKQREILTWRHYLHTLTQLK